MNREDWTKEQVESAINYIRDIFIFIDSKYPSNVKYNKELFKKINNLYPNMFSSVLEIYKLVTEDNPWQLFCPVCGKRNKLGFNHCSCRCTQLDTQVRNKIKNTSMVLYGNPTYNAPQKNKETCLAKYGCENVFQVNHIKEKSRQTKLLKYGNPQYTNSKKWLILKNIQQMRKVKIYLNRRQKKHIKLCLNGTVLKPLWNIKNLPINNEKLCLKIMGLQVPFN